MVTAAHNPDERYPDFPKYLGEITGDGATIGRLPGGGAYGLGSCPQCHAEDQKGTELGQPQPIASDTSQLGGAGKLSYGDGTPSERVPIRVECKCGSEHKREGKTGCGAIWWWVAV